MPNTKTKDQAAEQDAIVLLTKQHKEVADMFDEFENMSDRATTSKKKLVEKICEQLIMHTAIEEEIFYPAVREASKETEDMVDEAVVEHASAKDLIAQLQEADPGDELYDAKVKVLGEQIEHHVEEEEEEMFPKVRKLKLDLQALGQEMAARRDELLASA
ncbi:hemerythrin domain-containing protein [Massilia sp. YIM B02443]|jgi:hemerythrin superfamily protein|uniref:hemerythrin domain-containing protein n=1 Tax=Massilia sp. YIM B02443 TaxID=3050127 RepID=UPI0025B63E3F|nr:hemerythrin domain-containing protein [Massilia sp. YIM B02443]MDN4039647.1 hemerythrin domain-containing protein [Massilia sp. YIM B02443]